MNPILKILFFTLNIIEVKLLEQKFSWQIYFFMKVISTTKLVNLVVKKEFITTVFYIKLKTYIVYIANFDSSEFHIYIF